MTDDAVPDGRRTAIDLASSWLALPGSAAEPARTISALELDGYLTGVIVAPSLIRPSLWMAGLWADEGPVFDNGVQMQSALSSVGIMFNTLSARIDQSLRRLEAEHVCDYRPAFQTPTGKPSHDAIKTWVRGFWRAMTLAPTEWQVLAADERTQVAIMPFVGFIDSGTDETFEAADDIEDRLDDAAAQIPQAILLLRKIAQLRASRTSPVAQTRRSKLGRNDPCPCGSGKKYKRCCGQA
jgi:uncharacterized protein